MAKTNGSNTFLMKIAKSKGFKSLLILISQAKPSIFVSESVILEVPIMNRLRCDITKILLYITKRSQNLYWTLEKEKAQR